MRLPTGLLAGLLGGLLLLSPQAFAQSERRPAAPDSLLETRYRLDQQAAELQQHLASAQVVRADTGIVVRFAAAQLFEPALAVLRPAAYATLDSLAVVLQRYPHTTIVVTGYAAAAPGHRLAQQRARAVRGAVMAHGVVPWRITAPAAKAAVPRSSPEADTKRLTSPAPDELMEITIAASAPPETIVNADSL